jgi:hypothetical protein
MTNSYIYIFFEKHRKENQGQKKGQKTENTFLSLRGLCKLKTEKRSAEKRIGRRRKRRKRKRKRRKRKRQLQLFNKSLNEED